MNENEYALHLRSLIVERFKGTRRMLYANDTLSVLWLGIQSGESWVDSDDIPGTIDRAFWRVERSYRNREGVEFAKHSEMLRFPTVDRELASVDSECWDDDTEYSAEYIRAYDPVGASRDMLIRSGVDTDSASLIARVTACENKTERMMEIASNRRGRPVSVRTAKRDYYAAVKKAREILCVH